jgi:opacity protein-like surface antigen
MRKLGIALLALFALTLMTATVQAQTTPATGGTDMTGQWSIGAQGGLSMPVGKLAASFDPIAEETGADMKMGSDFGGYVDYFIKPQLAIGANYDYITNSMNDQTFEGVTFSDLLKAKTMVFGAHVKYMIPTGGKMLPYLGLGLNGYNRKIELSSEFQAGMGTTDTEVSDTVFGMAPMVGLDFQLSPMLSLGVNGAYHYTFGELKDTVEGTDVTVLKDWQLMTFNAALTYHMPKKAK